jgi:serine/threonine-protein kinase
MSGRLPYEASSLSELALMQQREAPMPLNQLNDRVPPELARAVALALAIEKEARPQDALSFGEVLRGGARGIEPAPAPATAGTGATRVLGHREDPTSATRVGGPRTARQPATQATPSRPARRLEAQPYQTGAYARAPYERAAERRGRGRRAGRRLAAFLAVVCLFAAAVIVAVVIATGTSNTAVQARKTVANDVNSAIQSVQNLIGQYTK